MFSQLRYQIQKGRPLLALGVGIAGAISVASGLGFFEGFELRALDQFLKMRASETNADARILVVTIGEQDISTVGSWPIPDGDLAELVQKIQAHKPAGIGIDLYRNLQIEPGSDELNKTFESVDNVVGIERVVGEAVAPHSVLSALGQTGSSDLVLDDDGKVRRGLLSIITPNGEVKETLATVLALDYLYALGIDPEPVGDKEGLLQLGKGNVRRFEQHDGGYVGADAGGFQVLMNYRQSFESFDAISMSAVLPET